MFKEFKRVYEQGSTLSFSQWNVSLNPRSVHAVPSIRLEETMEPQLKDRYQLHVYSDYTIRIRYGSVRSKEYAYLGLASLSTPLSVGVYEGGPDFDYRGIIEGFYGTPWTHENRKDLFAFARKYRMNCYFYAPKDDPYHRELWRESYPEQELYRLIELVSLSKDAMVDFFFCISPGKDFRYTEEDDFASLYRKIDYLRTHGVHHFALLLDDIDYQLTGESLRRFERPGLAHAFICNQLNRHLKQSGIGYELVMCPTEYAQNIGSVYRDDLANAMDPNIVVFWTGYNTVAEYIPNLDGVRLTSFFKHPLLLWDNYPVNDMAKDRLFMGPLRNRGDQLNHTHIGMVSNPMVEWHLSKLAMITMAVYMWNPSGYDPDQAYLDALREFANGNDRLYRAWKTFADENYDSLIYENRQREEQWVKQRDWASIQHYYASLQEAARVIEAEETDVPRLAQVRPWLDRIHKDAFAFAKAISKTAQADDFEHCKRPTHTLGKNMLLQVGIELGFLKVDDAPKKRMVFWELKAPQL